MPIYEFICQSCQKVTEHILMASDPRPEKCDECGGKLHKRLSAPAIQFKGSGWYVTDYAKRPTADGGNGAKAKPADGAAAPAGEGKEASAPAPAAKETPKEAPAPKTDAAPSKKEN